MTREAACLVAMSSADANASCLTEKGILGEPVAKQAVALQLQHGQSVVCISARHTKVLDVASSSFLEKHM